MKVSLIKNGVLGDDLLVANVARKSFGTGYEEWSEVPRSPRGRSDRQLIEDLAKGGHWLPFRHPKLIFECDAPIPIARQLGKHQVGMDWSEISRRYKTKGLEFYFLRDSWRADVKDRRQGSGDLLPQNEQEILNGIEADTISYCLNSYDLALHYGASPEQARFLLPQSMEVSWTWTGSLLAWAHMYNQRNHKDAQKETQEFAKQVGGIISQLFPVSWGALTNKKE